MRTLRFVTSNPGKLAEAREALAGLARVEPFDADPPAVEVQADDWEPVARGKAASLLGRVPEPYFVDDGGLAVDALGGFPGVYSAYALRTIGVPGILRLLEGATDRSARFECVVAYVERGEVATFRGRCDGAIARAPSSAGHGFGFDPVFVPDGEARTFAEIPTKEKNATSHRGKALAALARRLAGPA